MGKNVIYVKRKPIPSFVQQVGADAISGSNGQPAIVPILMAQPESRQGCIYNITYRCCFPGSPAIDKPSVAESVINARHDVVARIVWMSISLPIVLTGQDIR